MASFAIRSIWRFRGVLDRGRAAFSRYPFNHGDYVFVPPTNVFHEAFRQNPYRYVRNDQKKKAKDAPK